MNRNIVITGASRGLGLALVKKFLDQGDRVYGISRTRTHWEKAVAEISDPSRFKLWTADLTSECSVRDVVQKISRSCSGKIDLLINNAGVGGGVCLTHEENVRELDRYLKGNLYTAFLLSKQMLPKMRKKKKGMIVNVSSMAGVRAVPNLFAYSASKFGVLALSQCLAKENTDWDFKCLTVCPGGMNTEMRAAFFGREDAAKQQSVEYVAGVMTRVANGEIQVESGGHIVIRHGKIWGIFPSPAA